MYRIVPTCEVEAIKDSLYVLKLIIPATAGRIFSDVKAEWTGRDLARKCDVDSSSKPYERAVRHRRN